MRRSIFYLWVALFYISNLSVEAQFSKGYKAIPIIDTIPQATLTKLKARLESDKAAVDESSGRANDYARSLYKGRFDYIVQTFNDDKFIVDSEINQYMNEILAKIYAGNRGLPQDVSLYLYRSPVPNALSFGEGTIAFALSLLARMENEDQVAFVLCHELAHHQLKHTDLKVKDLTRINFDKKLNKQVREIKSSQYEQYSKLKDLMKGMELSLNRHSREHEFDADSIGLQFFLNTPYDATASVRSMEILDSVDRSAYRDTLELKKYFNSNEYPFKANWNQYTKSDTWFAKSDATDTAKTHPSCKRRAVALERQLKSLSRFSAMHKATNDKVFNYFKTASEFELVESEYHFKQYGKALFRAMVLLEKYPDNAWAHGMVGKCLYQLYTCQKNHTLGRVLDLPDPRFEENYDRFLTFLHQLRLSELGSLAYQYVTTKKEEFFLNEDFLYATWLCSQLPMSKLDPQSVKDDYVAQFPNGRYSKLMK
jgi:hypothetical protein